MKNPVWNNEELILALDLYFSLNYGQMDGHNPQVRELSRLLSVMNQEQGFVRSPGSVSLKLANFKRIDPGFMGKGMIRGGKLEKNVWEKYAGHKDLLRSKAEEIRAGIREEEKSSYVEEEEESVSYTEGGRKVFVSRKAERNPRLRKEAIRIHGCSCQACGFNYRTVYGEWGDGFIEVHHLIPLGGIEKKERETNPETDLVVLCANCHRMVHRRRGITLSLEELKGKINAARENG